MKSFLSVMLSIFIFGLLVLLGISISSKSVIVETTNIIIKEEVTKRIVETAKENTELSREEIENKVNEVLDENPKIKDFVSSYFDKFLDVINDKLDVKDIDLASEVDSLIDEARPILSEYGIDITDEMKNEVMTFVKGDEVNNILSEAVEEIKTSIPEEVKTMVKGFSLLLSFKFKMILVSLIVVFLVAIAFLKKSYYKWTINAGIPCVIVGSMFLGLVTLINKIFESEEITLNVSSMNTYGLINLILGVILIIVFIVLSNILKKPKVVEEA